ncbi:hypothetical protein [Mycobacterium sp. NPDC050041]|uniref:hypothetical protein n=1 Tax=Mycobacterium sp. NPDC050041 TaxID=3364293 RepID=UPI003C2C593C
MKRSLVGLGALVLVVGGCTDEAGYVLPPKEQAVATATSAEATTTTATDPSRPQPLGTALTLGPEGAEIEVTADEINQDSAPTIMPPGGGHWAGTRVRTCAKGDPSSRVDVGSSEWSATDAAGVVYNASTLTEVGFPDELYPTASTLTAGQCATGWVMFPAGFRAVLTSVTFTLDSATKATWTTPVQ